MTSINNEGSVSFGRFIINLETLAIWHDGASIAMPLRSKRLIALLINQADDVVDKDQLIDALWPDQDVSDWSLSRLISDTRHLLGDTAQDQKFIQTVRNQGFRWNAEITPVPAPSDLEKTGIQTAPRTWKRAAIIGGLLIATIGSVVAFRPRLSPKPLGPIRAVVLPVTVETGDDQDAWAEYGVMSLLANELRRFQTIQVSDVQSTISGLSQIQFDRNASPSLIHQSVCGALGCTHIVDASLQMNDAGQPAVSFRLISAKEATDRQQTTDGDVLQAAERAADEIVRSLVPVEPERPPLATMYTGNRTANQNFALGVSATLQRQFENAEQYLNIALREEPTFEWATLYLADVYAHSTRFDEANAILQQAESQDPDGAQQIFISKIRSNIAHETGALESSIEYANSMRDLAREFNDPHSEGIALMNSAATMQSLGMNREAMKRYEEALVLFDQNGQRLRHAQTTFNLGNAHFALGDLDTAEDYYRKASIAFRAQGADTFLSYVDYSICGILVSRQRYADAKTCYQDVRQLSSSIGDIEGVILIDTEFAMIALAESAPAEAITFAQRAYEAAGDEYAYAKSIASGMLAMGYLNAGDIDDAAAAVKERVANNWFDPRHPYVFIPASLAHAEGDYTVGVELARDVKQRIGDQWTATHEAWLSAFERAASEDRPIITDYFSLAESTDPTD